VDENFGLTFKPFYIGYSMKQSASIVDGIEADELKLALFHFSLH
jgi:ABC-type sulfate transport system substrate-binding protein